MASRISSTASIVAGVEVTLRIPGLVCKAILALRVWLSNTEGFNSPSSLVLASNSTLVLGRPSSFIALKVSSLSRFLRSSSKSLCSAFKVVW